MPFIENLNEFTERMDCGKPVHVGDRYLFRNGAQSTGTSHCDPPTSKWERLPLEREFLQVKLNDELKAFHRFQQECISQASLSARYDGLPGPPADAPEQLEDGRQRIAKLQAEVEAIDTELRNSPEALAEARQHQSKATHAKEMRDLLSRINSVNV